MTGNRGDARNFWCEDKEMRDFSDVEEAQMPLHPPVTRRAFVRGLWQVVALVAMLVSAVLMILSLFAPEVLAWSAVGLALIALLGPEVPRLAEILADREQEMRR